MPRADRVTFKTKQIEYFSDINPSFLKNPQTGDIARMTNEEAVAGSLRNLVHQIQKGEAFYNPFKGGKTKNALFEPIDKITTEEIQNQISHSLAQEDRANIINLSVEPFPDESAYVVTIEFECVHFAGKVFTVQVILKRAR